MQKFLSIATGWKPTVESEYTESKELSSGSDIISEEDFDKFLNEEEGMQEGHDDMVTEFISEEIPQDTSDNHECVPTHHLRDITNYDPSSKKAIESNQSLLSSHNTSTNLDIEKTTDIIMDYVHEELYEIKESFHAQLEEQQSTFQKAIQELQQRIGSLEEKLNKGAKTDSILETSISRADKSLSEFDVLNTSSMFADEEVLLAMTHIQPRPTRCRLARELIKAKLPTHLRGVSNCNGSQGKRQIDFGLLQAVEKKCFAYFPLTQVENYASAWQSCKDSINEWCRRINRYNRLGGNSQTVA